MSKHTPGPMKQLCGREFSEMACGPDDGAAKRPGESDSMHAVGVCLIGIVLVIVGAVVAWVMR